MQKFAEFILKFRLLIIAGTIAVTLFLGYFLRELRIDADLRGYLDEDEPSVMLLNRVMDEFGIYTMAIVAVETEDVFNYYTLRRIDEITRRLEEMDEIASVMSLTNVTDVRRTKKGLSPTRVIDIDNLPQDPEGFKNLRERVLADDLLRGLMVSEDGTTTLITATVGDIDLISIGYQIKEIVHNTTGGEKIHFSGAPFFLLYSAELILSNLRRLTPLAIIVTVVALYISFKSLYGVFLPLITVLISAIQTLGIMGLVGSPLTLISAVLPAILIPIGSAYGIHIISKYKEDVCSEENKIQEIKNALSRVSIPVLLAGITTSVGFFSLFTAETWAVQEFGLFTGIGTMLATAISLSFLPACLSFLKVSGKTKLQRKYSQDTRITRAIEKGGELTLRNKNFLIAGCIIFGIVGLLAVPRLRWETNLIEFFEEEAPLRKTEEMMMDKFGGITPIKLLVEGDIKDPLVLREMLKLQEYLELQHNINYPFSIADLIQRAYGRMVGRYTIPERRNIDFLWGFLEEHPMFPHMVNEDATAALIMLRLGTADKRETIEVVETVNRYLEEELRKDLVRVEVASAAPELVEVLRQNRVERIVSRISWEAEKRGIDNIPSENIRELIATSVSEVIEGRFCHNAKEMLRTKFRDYLTEETNLSEEIITTITDEIAARLLIRTPGYEELVSIIGENAPQLYAQDPEAVEWAAEDILEIINIDGEQARVSSLVAEIAPFLPDFNHEALRSKLWEVNKDWAGIDTLRYADFAELGDDIDRIKSTVSQAGIHIVMLEYDRILKKSLAESLSIAVFLVFVLSALRLKSPIGGLISLSPIFFTVLINFIVMVIFNVPVDVVTITAASAIVGIGIDYTIHFTSRFKFELAQTKSEPIALSNTWITTGKAIAINAFSVGAGFLVLGLADIVPMQRLGYLLALGMAIASSSSMTLLPALIVATRSRFIGPLEQVAEELILRAKEDFKKRKEMMELEVKKRKEIIKSKIKKRLNV